MKRVDKIAVMLLCIPMMWGCSSLVLQRSTYASDDMYAPHDRAAIIRDQEARAIAYDRAKEDRMEEWAQILGLEIDEFAREGEEYDTPFGERLRALAEAEDGYAKPSSYYEYQYQGALEELSKYDPDLYTASITSEGVIEIAPKYVSSIYGVWGSPYNNHRYAWAYGYPHWHYSSVWGYPHDPWWGWNYSFGYYNPWWGDPYFGIGFASYNWGYSYWYNPHHYPHRPPVGGGGSGGSITRSIVRKADAYTSPSSLMSSGSRRSDGSTVGRSTSTGSGSNNSTYIRNSSTTYSSPTRVSTPSSSGSSGSSNGTTIQRNSIGR